MLRGILSPAFLQAAGRAGKGAPIGKIILNTQFADPTIASISCTGEIKVTTIKNGAPLVETYSDLNGDALSIQADANTQIIISGAEITECGVVSSTNVDYTKISVKNTALTTLDCNNCYALTALDLSNNIALTELYCNSCYALTALDLSNNIALTDLECNSCPALTALDLSKNTALTYLDCNNCSALTALDLSNNIALTSLMCYYCYTLTALDLSKNTALTDLKCNNCSALTALDLSKNTALTTLDCSSCYKLVSISYPATNEDISTAVAGAITDAEYGNGTVYTDSDGAYYSTIATAATAKGWTIEQL